ncbi:MAG: hypothetical protein ACREMY_17245 [bacterium]
MGIIAGELTDDSPLVIVEISISSLAEQSLPAECKALVDTGANWSWITDELAGEAGILDTPRIPVEEFGLSPVTYDASGPREADAYAARITIGDTVVRTLLYTGLHTPPNATYKALLGCAVLWSGRFEYDGMSDPRRFTLEFPSGEIYPGGESGLTVGPLSRKMDGAFCSRRSRKSVSV